MPPKPCLNRLRARLILLRWRLATRRLAIVKRLLDITVSLLGLLSLSPLLLLVGIAIRLQDRGPVLFWQKRVGLNGSEFDFPKFRSMCQDAEAVRAQLVQANQHGSDSVTFKMKRDPRITPLGRFLRRTSIDELPQLWCVLRGEMSLVGPRPPLVSEAAAYSMLDRQRLAVLPGLTCTWQITGRAEIAFSRQVLMDIEYIQQRSVINELKLIAKTVPAVIRGHGAY